MKCSCTVPRPPLHPAALLRSESCLQAKEAYKQAVAQYETKQEALQGLIERREAAHQALLVPSPVPAEPGGSDAGAILQFVCQQGTC